ncbi:MAG: S8 family serine peptidase [Bryobacterales bacterium]
MKQISSRRVFVTALILLGLAGSALAAEVPFDYVVVLRAPSVAKSLSPSRAKQDAARIKAMGASVVEAQAPVKEALAARGVQVTGSVHNVLNAVFVRATREQARTLGEVAGVARVMRMRRFKPLLNRASQIVRADEAIQALGGSGRAGEGIRIGVIDTGIDQTHPAFQDNQVSPPAGFPKGRPEDLSYTNNKIIAARSYVHLLNPADAAYSRPDDYTPRDRTGHGTAVAMIAAGRPVNSPVGLLTGVAPKAFLGNYKIFGSPDLNEFTNDGAILAAMDDAVVDGMDILTVSFGAVAQYPWDEACDDGASFCDPVAEAAQYVIDSFGLVIVAAAGNAGAFGEQQFPTRNTISTPGTAPGVITVGATVNARQLQQSVEIPGTRFAALPGAGPELGRTIQARAVDAFDLGDSLVCSAFPAGSMQGAIAVIDRGGCDLEFKIEFAEQAGAIAAVIINVEGRDAPEVMLGLETTDIPAFSIGYSDGQQLITYLQNSNSDLVTLNPTLRAVDFASDQVAPFSSRGPGIGGVLKPEIVAPGAFIYSAAQRFDPNGDAFSETGFESVDGTSFAAPFVAGAAALVWQANPQFNSAQVKSALVNTAALAVFENGREASVTAVGAGLLDARSALEPVATAEPATISFGDLRQATLPLEQTLYVRNTSGSASTYRVAVIARTPESGARMLVNGATEAVISLLPNQESSVRVTLSGSRPSPGEYEGFLRISRDSGGLELLVPFYYAVGDNVPANAFVLSGTGVVGTVNEPHPELLIFKVVDQYGQPVSDLGVSFQVVEGGGTIYQSDPNTDAFGVAAADVDMGPDPGYQDFKATAGSLEAFFFNQARLKPFIGGMVNGAGFAANKPVAPGSIISIFGTTLAEFVGSASRLPLPIALKHVSISFDFPEDGISVPGHIYYVSEGQVNVQVPWELAGRNFAFVKARIEDSVSDIATLDLSDSAPGLFETNVQGRNIGIAAHADGQLVTAQNPPRRAKRSSSTVRASAPWTRRNSLAKSLRRASFERAAPPRRPLRDATRRSCSPA